MSLVKLEFDCLQSKGEVCHDVFAAIWEFCEDVSKLSDAIQNFDLKALGVMREVAMNA